MAKLLLRRFGEAAGVLVAVSMLSFALLDMAPGDYYDRLRLEGRIRPQTIQTLRAIHGEGQNLPARYATWIGSIFHGEWGYSLVYQAPAAEVIGARLGKTVLLLASTLAAALPISLLLATCAATRGQTRAEVLLLDFYRVAFELFTTGLLAIPDILLALFLLLLRFQLPRAAHSPSGSLWLPVLCLTLSILPLYLIHMQSALAEAERQPFIFAARANGIGRAQLLWNYLLPAAANPILTLIGSSPSALLSSSLVVEAVLGWPGLGQLLIESVRDRDLYLVADASLLGAVLVIGGNLVADCLLLLVDRRAVYR